MSTTRYAIFNQIKFDTLKGILLVGAESVQLEPKIQAFLLLLVESKNEIVPRETILQTLWSDPHKADERLRALVKKTREALGDSARSPIYIKTIPKQGYLFLPTVDFQDIEDSHLAEQIASPKFNRNYILIGLSFVAVLLVIYLFLQGDNREIFTPAPMITFEQEVLLDLEKDITLIPIAGEEFLKLRISQPSLDAYWNALQTPDLSLELIDKSIIMHGISNNATAAYLLTRGEESIEFSYWLLSKEQPITLDTTSLTVIPERILSFNFASQSLLQLQKNQGYLELQQLSLKQQSELQTLHRFESNVSDLLVNEGWDRVVSYTNSLTGSEIDIIHLNSKSVQTKSLNFAIEQMIWSEEQRSLLLKDKSARIYTLQLETLNLIQWHSNLTQDDQLLVNCGHNCLIIERPFQHQDLIKQSLLASENSQLNITTQLSETKSFPSILFAKDIYYLSDTVQGKARLSSLKGEILESLKLLPNFKSIEYLTKNMDVSLLAGTVADQMFVYDLETGEFEILNISISKVGFPVFDYEDPDLIYFTALDPVLGTSVFKYQFSQEVYEKVAEDKILDLFIAPAMHLSVFPSGLLEVRNDDSVIYSAFLNRYKDLKITPSKLLVMQESSIEIFDIESQEISQLRRPGLYNGGAFAVNDDITEIVFGVGDTSERQLIKLTEIQKSY